MADEKKDQNANTQQAGTPDNNTSDEPKYGSSNAWALSQQKAPEKFDPTTRLGIFKSPEEAETYRKIGTAAIDTTKDLYKSGPGRFVKGLTGKKSIIGMAAKNTFEFPVFVSKSIPLDYATAINSLLEQIYASYLQMAISLNPVIDAKTASRGGPFSNFKTNITKYVEYTDMFYAHDACYASYQNDEYMMEFNMISITDNEASIINESVDYQPLSEFDHYFQEADDNKPKYGSVDDVTKAFPVTAASMQRKSTSTSNEHGDSTTNGSERDISNATSNNGKNSKGNGPKNVRKSSRTHTDSDSTTTTTQSVSRQDLIDKALEMAEKMEDINNKARQGEELQKKIELLKKQIENENDPNKKTELQNRVTLQVKQFDQLTQQIDTLKAQAETQRKQGKLLDLEDMTDERALKEFPELYGALSQGEEIINRRVKLMHDTTKSGLEATKLRKELEKDAKRWKMELEKHAKDTMVRGPQFLDETKIQKLNTMKPLMMQVQLKVVDKNGGISAPVEYIVGVKTHCRLVDPETLPDVVSYPLNKMDKLTRKAKWRAGEIKFFDYLFNIKEKKQTAIDSRDPKRKWYRRLYELAHKKGDANVAKRISGNNTSGLIPNATIIVSQTDVDMIKANINIDLMSSGSARRLCSELFLMAFIVADLDAESIKVLLPDIDNDYEIHSLASVKKQLATLDTAGDKTRDMFKLLGK
jgi:hypothetical protein